MPAFSYGGQALIEGVLMRGKTALAVALRHPDGSIVWATERLDQGLRARRALKLPFLRGLVLLYDTLVTGTRWLVRSATVAAAEFDDTGGKGTGTSGIASTLALAGAMPFTCAASGPTPSKPNASDTGIGRGFGIAIGVMLLFTFAFAVGLFFLLPLFLAQGLSQLAFGHVDSGFGMQLAEGVIRVAIFVAYLLFISRTPDVKRVFRYHGAEHMSIHALEHGDPLTTAAVRKYPTAHPRCGTEFLVVVLIVSILAFALVGKQAPVWMILSRVALIPVIAAISYEILQFGAKRRRFAIVRFLWSPGIWVQMVTTKQPSDDMIEVAVTSLEKALVADGQQIPEGSTIFPSRPMTGELPPAEAVFEPVLDPEGRPLTSGEPTQVAVAATAKSASGAEGTRSEQSELLAKSASGMEADS